MDRKDGRDFFGTFSDEDGFDHGRLQTEPAYLALVRRQFNGDIHGGLRHALPSC